MERKNGEYGEEAIRMIDDEGIDCEGLGKLCTKLCTIALMIVAIIICIAGGLFILAIS